MRWQSSSLGPKRRGVMETSTLACGWPKPKHPARDPANQSTNTSATRKAFKHVRLPDMGPSPSLSPYLRLSLSLSLSFCVSEAYRREDTADGEQAIRRQPLGHPDKQLAKPWSGQPAAIRYFPLSHTHILSLSRPSPPVSEGIVRQESRQARRHRIGQEGR